MRNEPSLPKNAKPVEITTQHCAVLRRERNARDFSAQFQERIITRFVVTPSLKQTARDFDIAVRTVSEILLLAMFRRSVPNAARPHSPFVVQEMPAAAKVRNAA